MTNSDNILVVDDTKVDLQLLTIILTSAGYRVRSAESGVLALAAVDEELPALILLDACMPGMDGFAVCGHLKERQETRDIPVIFISISTDIEDHIRGFQLGGVDFVTKPFMQDELLARIKTHLTLRQVQHQLELRTAELLKTNEQLQVEIAHSASELRYRRLFESAKDGILILDAQSGMIVDVNPFLINLLGYRYEYFCGRRLWELGFFADIVASIEAFAELQQKQYIRYDDLPLETSNGQHIEVEFVSNVYEVGDERVIQCNIRDNTERNRAQQELRDSEARYRALFESSTDGIIITDSENLKIKFTNQAMCQMLGYTCEEMKAMGRSDIYPAESFPHIQVQLRDQIQGVNGTGTDVPCLRKDGTIFYADASGTVITIDGRMHAVGFFRDITERKQADALRISLEEQLRQQQRLETVGQLAAGVAHDFNNILTGITGFTQFALNSLPVAGATRDDLAEVLKLAQRAAELTRQLLAFSRRQPLQPVVLNINDVIRNLANMLSRLLGEHIKMVFELADDLGAVRVDPGQFEQVLMNLAVNARDAMPDGGILTIGTANAELDEEYSSTHIGTMPGSYVMLTVADSGCGMSAELLEHIFEPFFTTKGIGKGTGLGLATVYGIVKQHGGNIWVYSEPDHGTVFRTYFPQVTDEISAVAITESSNTCTGTETILIVEDDPIVLKVTQGILTKFGYHVLTAALPSLAETVLAEHGDTIALMLTDIMMPERNGHQLYESVHARFPHLRVLYMSGYPAEVIGNQGILDSTTAFISKPFTANALGQKVRDILDAKK